MNQEQENALVAPKLDPSHLKPVVYMPASKLPKNVGNAVGMCSTFDRLSGWNARPRVTTDSTHISLSSLLHVV